MAATVNFEQFDGRINKPMHVHVVFFFIITLVVITITTAVVMKCNSNVKKLYINYSVDL